MPLFVGVSFLTSVFNSFCFLFQDHFLCQECFTAYVESESDTEGNPQSVVMNGGRVVCPQKKGTGCDSHAFANKLIAMVRRRRSRRSSAEGWGQVKRG